MSNKSAFPAVLRGIIIKSNQQAGGGYSGLITDIAGTQYQLAPAHWLEEEMIPCVGMLVEFEPGIVEKGRLAKRIRAITTDTLLTPESEATWVELALEEQRSFKRRQAFHRLSFLVVEKNYPIERALCEIFDIELPLDVTYPSEPTEEDKRFVTVDLGPSRSPKKNNPVTIRLCDNLSLDLPRLLGFLRGTISYRIALELCLKDRRKHYQKSQSKETNNPDSSTQAQTSKGSWISKFIPFN